MNGFPGPPASFSSMLSMATSSLKAVTLQVSSGTG